MPNDLQDMMDTLIMPAALPVLREACILPALVRTDFGPEAAAQNATIRVPLPQDMGVADDMNPASGSSSTSLADPKVDIVLDQWKYKQFQMTDKEMRETVTAGVLPSAVEASIKSLANAVDLSLWSLYKKVPYASGTPGTVMDADSDIIKVREVMQNNLVPPGNRYLVLNVADEAGLLGLYNDASKFGSTEALREASLGRLYGFETYSDQLAVSHLVGTVKSDVDAAVKTTAAVGATTVVITSADLGTKTLKAGDIIKFANHAQPYTVAADAAGVANDISVTLTQPLKVEVPNTTVVTVTGTSNTSHIMSLAFHRDAFMFAARPLANEASENSTISVATDPVTGIPLRLETWREPGKATRFWRFDILFGVQCLRPELAVRAYGN